MVGWDMAVGHFLPNLVRSSWDEACIYYIKLQLPFVCLSVCLSVCLYPPPLSTRPLDRNQIWHTYSGRYGTHSQLHKFDPPHPRGNITSFVTSSNVEHVIHLKTTARRSMTWYYVMLAIWLATSLGSLPPSLAPSLPPSPPLPSPPLPSPPLLSPPLPSPPLPSPSND